MIDIVRGMKGLAIDIRNTTSRKDDRYEKLQDIIELCDILEDHYIDDGR